MIDDDDDDDDDEEEKEEEEDDDDDHHDHDDDDDDDVRCISWDIKNCLLTSKQGDMKQTRRQKRLRPIGQGMGCKLRPNWWEIYILPETNSLHQLRLVVYPIIYRVLYIPGACLGFLPSTVSPGNGWLEHDRFLLGPGLFSGAIR